MTHQQDTKGVRQVLDTFYSRRKQEWDKLDLGMINKDIFKSNCSVVMDEAETKLQEIMLGMLPEERDESASQCLRHWSDDPSLPCTCDDGDPKAKGFNTAIKLMEQNIRGGFNNG